MSQQFRHGDVLVQAVEALPSGLERLPHCILAHGEVTGHCHRIQEADQATLFRGAQGMYLQVWSPKVTLVHEEHGPIPLPEGFYRVWRQREYSPEEIRIVRD